MKRSLFKRGLQIAGMAGALGGSVLATAPAARADHPTGLNVIAAGGSDTTEEFMRAYLQGRTQSVIGGTTYQVQTFNVPANPGTPFVVPGDPDCPNGTVTYNNTTTPTGYQAPPVTTMRAPNGSGSGIDFLVGERATNPDASCIDIARSSSAPGRAGETSAMEYYAFGLDAVTWATQSPHAPATLTVQQIRDIYDCKIVNWQDVGGSNAPIQRLVPQAGSGTTSFFLSAFLGSSTFVPPAPGAPGTLPGCTPVLQAGIQENSGAAIPASARDTGIIGYSAGQWVFQANNSLNPKLDVRRGVRLGGVTTTSGYRGHPVEFVPGDNAYQLNTTDDPPLQGRPRPATVNEANVALAIGTTPSYPGVRYVFNAIDINNPSYLPSLGLVGFDNVASGERSPLCSGGALATILNFGFAPLPTTGGAPGSNLAGATCRRYLGTG